MILKPDEFSPIFSYGSIVSHKFIGNISKDRDKYRFRFELTFEKLNWNPRFQFAKVNACFG